MKKIVILALYKFVTLNDYKLLRQSLLKLMHKHQLKGTLLLAKEGINGTIAGERKDIDAILAWLQLDQRFIGLESKESYADKTPFCHSKVKLKQEIVTLGVADIDTKAMSGTYVKPKSWNALITETDVLLIDTRNDYETKIGSFKGAISPKTKTFREFVNYAKVNLDPKKHKKIAMYCTGGIRCEKSTAYLKSQGFDKVFYLKGGILKYLQDIPLAQSTWQGECFVFDNRVAVNHNLAKGGYDQCYACRHPITEADKNDKYYLSGVSCPNCYNKATKKQRQRFQEREKQMQLAKQRHEYHIGSSINELARKRRQSKYLYKDQQRMQSS